MMRSITSGTNSRTHKISIAIALCVIVLASTSTIIAQKKAEKAPAKAPAKTLATTKLSIVSFKDSLSYTIGMDVAKNIRNANIDLDIEKLIAGLRDMMSYDSTKKNSPKPILTEDDARQCLQNFQIQRMKEQSAVNDKKVKEAKVVADSFMAENKKKPGVITLPSGIQYKVLASGTGKSPSDTSEVTVHYVGKLIDGTTFDSSVERGQPITFRLNGLIDAWKETLPKMKVGDKWVLYAPPEKGYKEMGSPPKIGPNAVLIFELELLDVK
jgi:FKBP-type peptidyl-prolyl cis-trans isomerase FklB